MNLPEMFYALTLVLREHCACDMRGYAARGVDVGSVHVCCRALWDFMCRYTFAL